MVISEIDPEQLRIVHARLPWDYDTYRKETDHETGELVRFHVVNTSTASIRPRDQWGELGREIYNPIDVVRHAKALAEILQELHLDDFLVKVD